jgi:hypothetical protein
MRTIRHAHKPEILLGLRVDGYRFVHRHSNRYSSNVRIANARAWTTHQLLRPLTTYEDPSVVPTDALPEIVEAYELLDGLIYSLPKVQGYVCGYWIHWSGSRPTFSDFSAHVTADEAARWLEGWKAGGIGQPDQWVVEHRPAPVILFREANLPDTEIARVTTKEAAQ